MIVRVCLVGLISLSCVQVSTAAEPSAPPLVLYNANVYTVNPAQPRAEAVVAMDGRIAFVGTSKDALNRAPADATRVDLQGKTVFPGLTDAHAHLAGIGSRELEFNLEGTASLNELKQRLRDRSQQTKPGDWLTGRGWIESRWTPAAFPSRQDLDEVVSDRAVVLTRADGHALVANSLALKRAGIDKNTANPPGGSILKDRNGEPTGMLVDEAMELMRKHVPARTDEDVLKALEVGAQRSVRMGWTQLHNAGTSWGEVDLMCRLYADGRMKLKIYNAINGPGADADRLLREGASINRCGDRLTVRAIKLYIDGALGSRGALLLKPYSDAPEGFGLLVNSPEALFNLLVSALKGGIQIETHAIGDRGNRLVLDMYQGAFDVVPEKQRAIAQPRWRIEHAQVVDPVDIPRFARLGVIASMQPSHAIGDLFFAPKRLGNDRLAGAYAWRSMLDAGATVVAGSDAPVEAGDPRIEFYAAVARRSLEGIAEDNWHLEQRVSREQALKMLTLAPAYAAFQERERGSIEVGKQADFSVFSTDLMTIKESDILKAEIAMTVIAGRIEHRAPEPRDPQRDRSTARVATSAF